MSRVDHEDGSYTLNGREYVSDEVQAAWDAEKVGVVVAPAPSPLATTTTRYEGRRVDIAALLALPPQPIPWRVRDLVADGTITILAGESASGKSWLGQSLCVGVSRGHEVAGLECSRGPALYIDGEMGPAMFVDHRLRPAGIGAEFELRDAMGLDLSTAPDLAWLRGEIDSTGAKFVVIDSLRRLVPSKAENDSDAMAPVISALAKLARDTNAALLLIHHKGDSDKFFRGSTTIRDQADGLFAMLRNGDDDGVRRLSCNPDRGGKIRYAPEPSDLFLRIAPEQGGVVAADHPGSSPRKPPTPIADAVQRDILAALPCATKTEAAKKIGRAINDRTFREAWTGLEVAGTISTTVARGVVVVTEPKPPATTTTPSLTLVEGQSSASDGWGDRLGDLSPERPSTDLADAIEPEMCGCERSLPAPDEDGDLRCTRCGHACAGWGVPA